MSPYLDTKCAARVASMSREAMQWVSDAKGLVQVRVTRSLLDAKNGAYALLRENATVLVIDDKSPRLTRGLLDQLVPRMTHVVHRCTRSLVPGVLPTGLTHLAFGNKSNHSLVEIGLPTGLTHLTLGDNFNRPLSKIKVTHQPQQELYSCNHPR